jgi:hypothetical protein
MYKVFCKRCDTHIYDYTDKDLPKPGSLVDPIQFEGVNGYSSPAGGEIAVCPSCKRALICYRGPGYLGSFIRFEPKKEACKC